MLQHIRTITDQGRTLDRAGDLAVFNQVGLAGGEDKLARGDVDLSAAKIHGVQTLFH